MSQTKPLSSIIIPVIPIAKAIISTPTVIPPSNPMTSNFPIIPSIKPVINSNKPKPIMPLVINPVPPIVNTPLTLAVVPQQVKHTLTPEEKAQKRLQQKRDGQSRYREKSKAYTKLHGIKNDQGKIVGLLKILYPHLENVPDYVLEPEVLQFIASINRPR